MEHQRDQDAAVGSSLGTSSKSVLDVRVIANFVLDRAEERGFGITNMALNKIIYFVHCDYLMERQDPLVGAKIEAWQHGPVFREVYHEFKRWDNADIGSRATKIDPHTGEVVRAEANLKPSDVSYLRQLIDRYVHFTAAQLRAMSHREGGPWHRVWGHDGRANPGMRITTDLIYECYLAGDRQ